eukprot:5733070-Heterocapsa_arctica.AAC.1
MALSREHLLTYKPANPYCDACNRGKCVMLRNFTVLSNVAGILHILGNWLPVITLSPSRWK